MTATPHWHWHARDRIPTAPRHCLAAAAAASFPWSTFAAPAPAVAHTHYSRVLSKDTLCGLSFDATKARPTAGLDARLCIYVTRN